MMTRSGSGSSASEEIQDGILCSETENLGCHILDEPESHGSKRMVKEPEEGVGCAGLKDRRKEASELRCLTVKDIFEALNNAVAGLYQDHSMENIGVSRANLEEEEADEEE